MTEWAEKTEKLMRENLNKLETDLRKIRSSQISLEVVEELIIEQQGKKQKIKDLAALKINSDKQLVVRAFESKKIQAISKTVLESKLGYQQVKMERDEIYFSLPPMTGETRQQLIKNVREMIEQGKVALRISRQKILKEVQNLVKKKELSQNEQKLVEKEVEKINEKYLKKIQEIQAKKEKELTL